MAKSERIAACIILSLQGIISRVRRLLADCCEGIPPIPRSARAIPSLGHGVMPSTALASALASAVDDGAWTTVDVFCGRAPRVLEAYTASDAPPGTSAPLTATDLESLPALFTSKDAALATGVALTGRGGGEFAVHRVHPAARPGVDLVYGRGGDASSGCGVVVARVRQPVIADEGAVVYVLVTYRFPSVSALAVERLLQFADGPLRAAAGDGALLQSEQCT